MVAEGGVFVVDFVFNQIHHGGEIEHYLQVAVAAVAEDVASQIFIFALGVGVKLLHLAGYALVVLGVFFKLVHESRHVVSQRFGVNQTLFAGLLLVGVEGERLLPVGFGKAVEALMYL